MKFRSFVAETLLASAQLTEVFACFRHNVRAQFDHDTTDRFNADFDVKVHLQILCVIKKVHSINQSVNQSINQSHLRQLRGNMAHILHSRIRIGHGFFVLILVNSASFAATVLKIY